MYNVQFPGLGINVTINPVAFKIAGHSFAWYGVIIATGFLLAFLYAMVSSKRFRVDQDKLVDVIIVGIIGGIIGARLYYVLFFAGDQYVQNPISILYIWEGGLGIYGGIIGGLLCGALIAKLHKLSVPAVLDIASLGFLIGQSIGRWGNFINQEAFGTETNLPWRMVSENTANVGVHPCFLYESLWCILGFALLHIFSRKFRRYDGQVFLIYMIWYGTGRFFIEGLRTDSLITPVIPLRISQVVAAVAVLASIVLLVVFRNRTALTGCGSAKIMELNSIVDEVPVAATEEEEPVLEGESTIFANTEDAKEALAAEPAETAPEEKTENSDSGTDAEPENPKEASVPSEASEPTEDAGEKQ